MRAAKLKRKKETRAERAIMPPYADVVAARDVILRQAIEARQVRSRGQGWPCQYKAIHMLSYVTVSLGEALDACLCGKFVLDWIAQRVV
jgi:hypothetical protein